MSTRYAGVHRVAVSSVLDAIGDTPVLEGEGVFCRLEYLNPSGSIKARIANMSGHFRKPGGGEMQRSS